MLMVPDKYAQPCTERQINEMLDVEGLYNLAHIDKLMRHLILMVATQILKAVGTIAKRFYLLGSGFVCSVSIADNICVTLQYECNLTNQSGTTGILACTHFSKRLPCDGNSTDERCQTQASRKFRTARDEYRTTAGRNHT